MCSSNASLRDLAHSLGPQFRYQQFGHLVSRLDNSKVESCEPCIFRHHNRNVGAIMADITVNKS